MAESRGMVLSRSAVEVLIAVVNGSDTLESLQKELNTSKSWVCRIGRFLVQQGFVRNAGKGRVLRIEIADTPHGIAFREMYLDKPYRKYPEVFSGRNLDVLLALATGEKSIRAVGRMMGVQARMIRPRISFLAGSGLIIKKGKRYALSSSQEKAIAFLRSLRNFSGGSGMILWKYGRLVLLKANKPIDSGGELTGFQRYADLGIGISAVSYLYFTGKKKLSIEDIFVHSLFEISDQRSFAFAVALYAKKRLFMKKRKEKILELAEIFDRLDIAYGLITSFEMIRGRKIKEQELHPLADIKEIERMLGIYGVNDV